MVQNVIAPYYLSSLRILLLSSFRRRYIHLDQTLNDLKQTFRHKNWGSEEDVQLFFFLRLTRKSLSLHVSFSCCSLFPKEGQVGSSCRTNK